MSDFEDITEGDFMNSVVEFNFENPTMFHDRVLLVEDRKFHVQSGLLSMWCDYFKTMFNSEFKKKKEHEIELDDISAEEFEVFLKVIYPGRLYIQVTQVESLIGLAHRFLAPNVLQLCKNFIKKEFDALDKIKLLEVAVAYNMKGLKAKALSHIKKNVKSLNFIQLLKLAFDLHLDELKECLRNLINKPGFNRYRCDSCPNRIQLAACTHITLFRNRIKCISLIAYHKEEILQLPSEIQSFVLSALISDT